MSHAHFRHVTDGVYFSNTQTLPAKPFFSRNIFIFIFFIFFKENIQNRKQQVFLIWGKSSQWGVQPYSHHKGALAFDSKN